MHENIAETSGIVNLPYILYIIVLPYNSENKFV